MLAVVRNQNINDYVRNALVLAASRRPVHLESPFMGIHPWAYSHNHDPFPLTLYLLRDVRVVEHDWVPGKGGLTS